jgi:hypothetical protein
MIFATSTAAQEADKYHLNQRITKMPDAAPAFAVPKKWQFGHSKQNSIATSDRFLAPWSPAAAELVSD